MFTIDKIIKNDTGLGSDEFEFWPARAESLLDSKNYKSAAEFCEANISDSENILSGRLIYAVTLYHLKEFEKAADQFYHVLTKDPDNITALKNLGDIHYKQGDVVTALASYSRVMELDPGTKGLKCEVRFAKTEEVSSIKIVKPPETKQTVSELPADSPFITETIGELYLKQGQPRLALEIFRELSRRSDKPHLKTRLAEVEKLVSRKEKDNVR